ncbi:MAG: hypothetical protein HN791_08410 [Gammaproteobacteria bacterium]|jgi:omega-hydroxy-beta-dihydromenaquinone-9 sulfotransferase|nr:hypothetical protein [Gammaproteobacteria bacterium]
MLEKDQQYTYLSLWQSLFNSMTLYKFVDIIGALGKKNSSPIAQMIDAIDRHFFKGWDRLHKVGLRFSEEVEFLFVSSF